MNAMTDIIGCAPEVGTRVLVPVLTSNGVHLYEESVAGVDLGHVVVAVGGPPEGVTPNTPLRCAYRSVYRRDNENGEVEYRVGTGVYASPEEVFALRDSRRRDWVGVVRTLPEVEAAAYLSAIDATPATTDTLIGKCIRLGSRVFVGRDEIEDSDDAMQVVGVVTRDGLAQVGCQEADEFRSIYDNRDGTFRAGRSTFDTAEEVFALRDSGQTDFAGAVALSSDIADPSSLGRDTRAVADAERADQWTPARLMEYALDKEISGAVVYRVVTRAGAVFGLRRAVGGGFRSLYGDSPEDLRLGRREFGTAEEVFALRDSRQPDFLGAALVPAI